MQPDDGKQYPRVSFVFSTGPGQNYSLNFLSTESLVEAAWELMQIVDLEVTLEELVEDAVRLIRQQMKEDANRN